MFQILYKQKEHPMRDLRVALAQLNCPVGRTAGNLEKHRLYAWKAAEQAAEIVCFPETSLTGYTGVSERVAELAQPADGQLAREFTAISAEAGIPALAGFFEIDEETGQIY